MSLDPETRSKDDLLREQEHTIARLRQIIDSIPDFIYLKDRQSRYMDGNQSFYTSLGATSIEAIKGMSDRDYFPPKDAEQFLKGEQEIFASGKPARLREQGTKEDGTPRYLQTSKIPLFDPESNEVCGLVGITRDISDLVEMRHELAAKSAALETKNEAIETQRKELQTLIDNIPDFIYFKDTESRYLNGNDKFYLGLNAPDMESLVGKWDFDFFPKETAQGYYDDEQEMFRTGTPVSKEERGTAANGDEIHLQTTKTPIYDTETGSPIGMVGISRNITELKNARESLIAQAADLKTQKDELSATLDQLKQAQSKLVQSEKMASLGVLTAGIAHEINNPINFVYAGVNSMVKDFEDVKAVVEKMRSLPQAEDKAKAVAALQALAEEVCFDDAFEALEETLKDIKLGATRITEIVAGLSKFSRLGKETWQITNLHDDIDSVLVLLKNKYKSHITIERRYHPEMPQVECFPGKLNQAIMNILSNAIDAIDARGGKGAVTITTGFSDSRATIAVNDDGTGMSDEVRAKIFDPFFTTKEIGKGVGLGLAITYSIIQDHEGELTIETQEGVGSEFLITLPIRQQNQETPNP